MDSLSIASDSPATREDIRAALQRVIDPEIGINIVDLGLVYDIESKTEGWRIALTMTSPACPMGQSILDDVQAVIDASLAIGTSVDIDLVWEPPWEPAMMSDAARDALGWSDD
ncbi:metal-sulfur cluster assembly factor [Trinickia acidisoli]|uniref:metal-sulfur cluster assembly factor n=1 Tax=Trinickia acidisoli TaxID=2767482 RepID=UPI001A903E90|nr:metal-sulfur cluster assembly factor [Trinickia acidisoli]